MKRLATLAFSLLLLLVAVSLLRHWTAGADGRPMLPGLLGELPLPAPAGVTTAALSLGLLLLGAFLLGEMLAMANLPRVSGALLFGVLAGPELHQALGLQLPVLVPRDELRYLELIDALAVSLIGLVAGGEIRIEFLRRTGAVVARLVVSEMTGVLLLIGAGLTALSGFVPLLAERTAPERWYLTAVLAAMGVANSPAIVTAMLRETNAAGVFARTSLAVTVVKDLTLVVLVSALLAAWSATHATSGGSPALAVAWHLSGSLLVGALFAGLLGLAALKTRGRLDLVVVVAGFAIALAGRMLSIAPLLAGITAGFALANLLPRRSVRLFRSIDDLLPATYALFFAVAGARIGIASLATLWPLALGLSVLRVAGIWTGLRAGCAWARVQPPVRTWLWTSMVPQAGVSIALAAEARAAFAGQSWADALHALLLAVVALHEIVGPPLMRLGLLRSGEVQR
jgi:Kef-type K+ transport system membrane component KefB